MTSYSFNALKTTKCSYNPLNEWNRTVSKNMKVDRNKLEIIQKGVLVRASPLWRPSSEMFRSRGEDSLHYQWGSLYLALHTETVSRRFHLNWLLSSDSAILSTPSDSYSPLSRGGESPQEIDEWSPPSACMNTVGGKNVVFFQFGWTHRVAFLERLEGEFMKVASRPHRGPRVSPVLPQLSLIIKPVEVWGIPVGCCEKKKKKLASIPSDRCNKTHSWTGWLIDKARLPDSIPSPPSEEINGKDFSAGRSSLVTEVREWSGKLNLHS